MNKKLLLALIATGSISASTFAMDFSISTPPSPSSVSNMGSTATSMDSTTPNTGSSMKSEFKSKMNGLKEQYKPQVEAIKGKIKESRDEFKSKMNGLKEQYKPQIKQAWQKLDKTTKEKIKEVRKQYLPEMKKLKEEFNNSTKDQRKAIMDKINGLRENFRSKVKEIAGNTDFEKFRENRINSVNTMIQDKKQNIGEFRASLKDVRTNFKMAREELVVKYKTMIVNKLSSKINNFSVARLEKIQKRIENAKNHILNSKMSDATKTKVMSAIDALNQVIAERLNNLNSQVKTDEGMDVLNGLLK